MVAGERTIRLCISSTFLTVDRTLARKEIAEEQKEGKWSSVLTRKRRLRER